MKIKLPKRFYTPEQLAEHWECKVEDVTHLIETGELETVDKQAALNFKKYVVIEAVPDLESANALREEDHPEALTCPVVIQQGETEDDAIVRRHQLMESEGMLDPVIMAETVEAYPIELALRRALDGTERLDQIHGEPTEDTAPLPSWPWGEYERPLLRILADAVDHFCVKNDLARYPKKESDEVANWIMDRMKTNGMPVSKSLASAIETLISPRDYSHQRQRKQGKP